MTRKFPGRVFCSERTANLVAGIIKLPRSQIYPLKMETPTMVEGVECTLIDANHCPGAAIIVFKLPNGKVHLHTGDFRATEAMARHPLLARHKIDSLYLDTTYCDRQYVFPPQEQVVQQVVEATKRMVKRNKETLVFVGTYSLGKERIFIALAKALGCKACVLSLIHI